MTCIVGIAERGGVVLGADSASAETTHWIVRQEQTPKVFRLGKVGLGFTSSWRMGQLLRYQCTLPPRAATQPLEAWLVGPFIDAVRTCLKAGGFATKEKEVETAGTFLLAVEGRLFTVQDDYQVTEPAEHYASVGSGRDYALGVLHATRDLKWPASNRLRRALRAAAYHTAYVRAPFRFLRVK